VEGQMAKIALTFLVIFIVIVGSTVVGRWRKRK
jgi:hypothetical protein